MNKFNPTKQISFEPSFASRLPNRVYYNVKNIPNLRCASCDEVMLTYKEIQEIEKSFNLPAKEIFDSGLLSDYEDSEVYKFILSWAKRYPKRTIDGILAIPDVQREINALKSSERKKMSQIAKISRQQYLCSSKFVKKLEKYSGAFKDEKKELYNCLKYYANKYPQNTFSEIFQKPEVHEFHLQAKKHERAMYSAVVNNVFYKVNQMAESFDNHDYNLYIQAVDASNAVLNKHDYDSKTKKQYVLYRYYIKLKGCHNQKLVKKIMRHLNNLPETSSAHDAIIAKQVTDKELLKVFLNGLQISYDHVKAKIYKGDDLQGNGIYLCRHCNNKRGSLSYPFLFHKNPDMPKFIQKQVSRLISFITHKKLKGYDYYPLNIKETLFEESKKRLNLNIDNYLKFQKANSNILLENAQKGCDKISSDLCPTELDYDEFIFRLGNVKTGKDKL